MGRNMSAARTDGFIRNIHSRNPFDVIRADVVISRLEKQAHWGCGLHYEIYEANLFDMAMNHLSRLPLKDRPVFIGAAARKGLFLAPASPPVRPAFMEARHRPVVAEYGTTEEKHHAICETCHSEC
ncbi:hypothetical protein LQT54_22380 (plasmid) [Escherichia coli]|nr:hypothetical protein [Escherichia coli]